MHNNTPEATDVETMDDEDILNQEDVVELIELDEVNLEEYQEIEDEPIKDDAKYIFDKHTKPVFCGSLSGNGNLAVTGGEDDKAYVWDTINKEIILECSHDESVVFVGFNYDSTLVATADMDGVVQVWKLKDKKLIWSNQICEVTWMQWHAAANILFVTSVEGEIYMWKIPSGDCKTLQTLRQRIETASLLPDGKRLAVGYDTGIIRIMDLKNCTVLHTITSDTGHTQSITSIDSHPNNNLIISASMDGTTMLSQSHTGKIISVLQRLKQENNMECDDESNWVESVKFHDDPTKSIAAAGTSDGDIFIWDISKQMLRIKINVTFGITKLIWKKDSTLIFAAALNGIVACCDGWTGENLKYYSGHTADVLDICIARDGKTLLTTSDDHTARIFEIEGAN